MLRDDENRRFCPVPVTVHKHNIMDFDRFMPLVPQLWAEALVMYEEARKAKPKAKGQLNLTFQSQAAKDEAEERQTAAREIILHEAVAEIVQAYLDRRMSAEAVSAGEPSVDDFDGDEDSPQFVRNYVTVTMLRVELAQNPILQDIKMAKDKVLGQAMRSMDSWEFLGNVTRLGKRVRWYCRAGLDNSMEFVPATLIEEVDVSDLLA